MSDERYEIRDKLGQGGVGAVYKAFDTQLNREVAIKRVLADGNYEDKDEATKHLLKEATALSSVQHPHIVTVYDAGVDDDGPYVVMELIDGKTLDEMVERGTLTWDDLREIALQSQEALIAAQDLNLVHRDLKPSNLMVCWLPSGKFQVKIVDFGLAKFSATPSLQTIDHGDAVFGSIFFMAPEQFERTPLDKRTDMYAMGCLYYYALTGENPFSGDTAAAVMASHLQHHVTPLHELRPDIPRWGADWIMWHIERNMDDRPTDARTALERFLILDKQGATGPVTLSANPNTGPQLIIPGAAATGPVTAHNAATGPHQISAVDPSTAPQPISPPQAGVTVSPHTRAQQIANETALQTATGPVAGYTGPQQALPVDGVQPATEEANFIEAAKLGLSQRAKWAIIGILSLVILVVAIIGFSLIGDRNETEMVNKIMVEAKALDDKGKLQDGIKLDEDELEGILKRATSSESNQQRPLVLKTLAYAIPKGDFNMNGAILEHITQAKCSENIRTEIFRTVMTRRPDVENIPLLLSFANSTSEGDSAAAAIDAARKSATGQPSDNYINDFISLIKDAETPAVRGAAERAAVELIAQSDDKASFSQPILGAYETAIDDDAKFAMLRLAGTTGDRNAAKIVNAALKSNDNALKHAAVTALGQWADDSEFQTLVDFIQDSGDLTLRQNGFDAAYDFLRDSSKIHPDDIGDHWKSLAGVARNQREKLKIISAMANQKDEWAVPITEFFTEDRDDRVADRAEQAKIRLEKNIRENN